MMGCVGTAVRTPPAGSEVGLLGEVRLEAGTQVEGTPVGGLSALAYDAQRGVFVAVSDDSGILGPVRLYELRIDVADGDLEAGDVRVEREIRLGGPGGGPVRSGTLDPEGVVRGPDGSLYVSSEGFPARGVAAEIIRFSPEGAWLESLALPAAFDPDASGASGVRPNRGPEALALSSDGTALWVGFEAALRQDGPEADFEHGSLARILRLNLDDGRVERALVYPVGPIPGASAGGGPGSDTGLSELVDLGDGSLLALERSWLAGVGNRVRLYRVWWSSAQDVRGVAVLPPEVVPARKELVADLGDLGVDPDNLEGAALGPRLVDGRRTLILLSDDNFNSEQSTQVVALAVPWSREPAGRLTIPDVQGASQRSPLEGRAVRDLEGVVTAPAGDEPADGYWVQDPLGDGDPWTSDGILVIPEDPALDLSVGEVVRVSGRVEERAWPGGLPVTTLVGAGVERLGSAHTLPPPVTLGVAGRRPPADRVDDDRLGSYDPDDDAIDFFESLEGMRARVDDALVVGPTSEYGEIVVLADGGVEAGPLTARGGIRLTATDVNPERVVVSTWRLPAPPRARTGDRLAGPLIGVLDYAFGHYRLSLSGPLPPLADHGPGAESTMLHGDDDHLTVATVNVENLSARSPADKLAGLAELIGRRLAGPDLVALQEVQDDSGPVDDGTVTASRTLARLVDAVAAGGGPRYLWRQIDPDDGADGGQPGGNIRVAYLFNPARVDLVDRPAPDPRQGVEIVDGPHIKPSPGRVAPSSPAFTGASSEEPGTRKPLAAELRFNGRTLFVVNNHLVSKLGDDSLFGSEQPPRRPSEKLRAEQALVVRGVVERILAEDPDAAVVVLGDLNEHEFRPPVELLADDVMVDLVLLLEPDDRYTYVYMGNSQVLDHVLVTPAIAVGAEIDAVHGDAESPESLRPTDHDPLLVRLVVPGIP
jgi:endonuclease/exonuclease/phosphatase family metal-dependent hydrolase